jgi:hypothetical protein
MLQAQPHAIHERRLAVAIGPWRNVQDTDVLGAVFPRLASPRLASPQADIRNVGWGWIALKKAGGWAGHAHDREIGARP